MSAKNAKSGRLSLAVENQSGRPLNRVTLFWHRQMSIPRMGSGTSKVLVSELGQARDVQSQSSRGALVESITRTHVVSGDMPLLITQIDQQIITQAELTIPSTAQPCWSTTRGTAMRISTARSTPSISTTSPAISAAAPKSGSTATSTTTAPSTAQTSISSSAVTGVLPPPQHHCLRRAWEQSFQNPRFSRSRGFQ